MALETELGPGKWPVNQDRLGWPWKLDRAGKDFYGHSGDARREFKAIAAC